MWWIQIIKRTLLVDTKILNCMVFNVFTRQSSHWKYEAKRHQWTKDVPQILWRLRCLLTFISTKKRNFNMGSGCSWDCKRYWLVGFVRLPHFLSSSQMVGLPKVDFQVPVKVCIMCIHSRKLSRLENQTCVRNLKPICEFGEAWNQVHLQYECIILSASFSSSWSPWSSLLSS